MEKYHGDLTIDDIRKHVQRKLDLARLMIESPALSIAQRQEYEYKAGAYLDIKVFIDYGTPELA